MENASKALIIAGAILLAILIITLGIVIYQQASGVINNSSMTQVEITQFNTQFTQYQGKQRGSVVKSLYQIVLANNISQDSDDRRVAIDGPVENSNLGKTDKKLPSAVANIATGSTYNITIEYGEKGGNAGLVDKITITSSSTGNK